jgi:hypothetical protein
MYKEELNLCFAFVSSLMINKCLDILSLKRRIILLYILDEYLSGLIDR